MNKALLLTTKSGFKGPHKITVGSRGGEDEFDWSYYGWDSSYNFGKMTPQEIEGFPIIALYNSYMMGVGALFLDFAKNSNVNFESIRVTRMDNQRSASFTYTGQNRYQYTTWDFFSKPDVGKTIELIFEAT